MASTAHDLLERLTALQRARSSPASSSRSVRQLAPPEAGRELQRMLRGYCEARNLAPHLHATMARDRTAPSIYAFAEWLVYDSGLYLAGWEAALQGLIAERRELLRRAPESFPVVGDAFGHTSVPWWLAVEVRRRLARRHGGAPSLVELEEHGGFDAAVLSEVFPRWRDADSLLAEALNEEQIA